MGDMVYTVAEITREGGEKQGISLSIEEIDFIIPNIDEYFSRDMESAFTFVPSKNSYMQGLDFYPPCTFPCKLKDNGGIVKPGNYLLLDGVTLTDEAGEYSLEIEHPGDSPIISINADAIYGDGIAAKQFILPLDGEEPDTFEGFMFEKQKGVFVTLDDVAQATGWACAADYLLAYGLANNKVDINEIGEAIHPRIAEIAKRLKPKQRRRKQHNYTQTSVIKYPNDAVSLAIMQRFKGHIEPSEYFSNGLGREIKTGDGSTVRVRVQAPPDVEITAPEKSYVLDDATFFWTTMLFNVARDTGKREIYGSDILKRAGWKNPYKDESLNAMASAAESITKALRTWLAVDTTNERRKKGRKGREVLESFGLKPAISGGIEFITEAVLDDDGNETGEITRDFVITLNSHDEIAEAFPLFAYAISGNMLLTVGRDEFEFKGLRLTEEQRRMWFYILRRIKAKHINNNKIKFSTMWETLGLEERGYKGKPVLDENGKPLKDGDGQTVYEEESDKAIKRKQADAMRKKKERMIAALEKMLYQASGGLKAGEKMKKGQTPKYRRRIDSWKYTTDTAGRVDGVEVKPLKDEK